MDNRPLQHHIFRLIEPTVDSLGFELVAVELTTVEGRRTLRISVDRPGGIDAAALKQISHAVSPVLDVDDPLGGAYHLELSSPGIERPLQRPRDFIRFKGYRLKVRLQQSEPRRRYTGVLRGFHEGQLLMAVDGEDINLDFSLVEQARLDLSLDEYHQLGKATPARASDQELL